MFLGFDFLPGDRLVGWEADYGPPEITGFSWEEIGPGHFRIVEE